MLTNIKNIIFDFGGVLLNIDESSVYTKLNQLGSHKGKTLQDFCVSNNVMLQDFEKGKISTEQFRNKIREYSGKELSDEEIDSLWNGMLLDLPFERLEVLKNLKKRYRIFLLSNTNELHIPYFFNMNKERFGKKRLSDFFEKEYYSYEIGMRKPNKDIFIHVLQDSHLSPQETLFIDDNLENIIAAKKVGLRTHHLDLTKGETIGDVFNGV